MRNEQLSWVGLAVSILSIVACHAVQAADIKSLPNHSNYTCYINSPPNKVPVCGLKPIELQPFAVKSMELNTPITACVVAFPYNTLEIKNGQYALNAPDGLIKWTLPAGPFVFGSRGVSLTPVEGSLHNDLFTSRAEVKDAKKTVEVKIKAGVKGEVRFDHLPVVRYVGESYVGGPLVDFRCAGIDPVIVNNAD